MSRFVKYRLGVASYNLLYKMRIKRNATTCGIIRHVPQNKKNEIFEKFNVKILHNLDYGIYSDILIDIDINNVKEMINQYSYKNIQGTHIELLPYHIECAIKKNVLVRKLYQLENIFPEIEIQFSQLVSHSKYHVRLKNISDFEKVRNLEKQLRIPENYYRPTITLQYFDHFNNGRFFHNMLQMKCSSASIGFGLNNVQWNQFCSKYNVKLIKRTSQMAILEPRSIEAYNKLMSFDPNSPKTPFICSLYLNSSKLLLPGSFYAPIEYFQLNYNPISKQLKNEKSEFVSNEISQLLKPNNTSLIDVNKNNKIKLLFKNNDFFEGKCFENYVPALVDENIDGYNLSSIQFQYIPTRPYIYSNIIQFKKENFTKEISDNNFLTSIKEYCWKYTQSKSYIKFYLKSYDDYIKFYQKYLLKEPFEFFTNLRANSIGNMLPNLLKGIYPWNDQRCFTITMKDISKDKIKHHLKDIELSLIYIPSSENVIESENEIENQNQNQITSQHDFEFDELKDFKTILETSNSDTISKPKPNTAYIKLGNIQDFEKLLFLNGKNDINITGWSLWNSIIQTSSFDSVPILNEFIIDGISSNVTLSDIRKWLGNVETNTIIRDNEKLNVRVFLCDSQQIEKLMNLNFTTFDNNFVTISQATMKVDQLL